jgi:purine-binding chemotaxis protein CheW
MNSASGSSSAIELGGRVLLRDEHGRRCVSAQSEAEVERSRGDQAKIDRPTIEPKQWFCFFRCDAGPLAVAVESVAGVLETDTLVRLPWSPPQIVGMCSCRRDVVPVVFLGPPKNGSGDLRCDRPDRAAAIDTIRQKSGLDGRARTVVLVLKTGHGAWGICVEPETTVLRQESPEILAPRMDATGPVVIGSVGFAETRFGILDAEATWRGLRSSVARWSGLMSESDPSSSPRRAEEPSRADARVAAELCEG